LREYLASRTMPEGGGSNVMEPQSQPSHVTTDPGTGSRP
jgi:hypothetical protein